MLLRSRQDQQLFLTLTRWYTVETWETFWEGASPEAMRETHAVAQRLSAEACEEIADHAV